MPTTKRVTKTKATAKVTKKISKATVRRSSPTKATVKKIVNESFEPSLAVKIIALMLILLGYAVYRFYPIATVNGQVISRLRYYQVMEAQLGKATLNNLVTENLILDAARQQNLVIPQADIDAKIASVEAQIKNQGMDLAEALEQEGLTKQDLEREIMLQQIVETIGKGQVTITDAQIDDFLAKNGSTAPQGSTQAELREMAKTQLESDVQRTNISTWLSSLKDKATIIYR